MRSAMRSMILNFAEVKSSYLELANALQQIHRSEETLASSSGQLELADKRYNAGLGNIIELTNAERFYIQDDAVYVDALYSYSVARAKLEHAIGTPRQIVESR
jgi:outer membrane protein